MGIYANADLLNKALTPFRKNNKIGFVPTMGALHSGHLALVERALEENDCVVVSIFVNPTQFNNQGDLDKYPRTLDDDVALLGTLSSKIFIYAPKASALYSGKIVSEKYDFGGIEYEMEGKHRLGHFDGVGTVLNILFRNVAPQKAYFGEKDFQQFKIVEKLVEIENLPVEIIGCDIVREENGLAKSSRNKRLSSVQQEEASILFRTLKEVKAKFDTCSISELNKMVAQLFSENTSIELEYFEIADENSLKTVEKIEKDTKYRAFIAAFVGEVRLIDNLALN